jgi:hypothetical protein
MTAVADTSTNTVRVSMESGCDFASCSEFAHTRYTQLNCPTYSRGVSIMECPHRLSDWRLEHRTARKRADKAQRLGYRFAAIDRSEHNDAIHDINTSMDRRQGRPMSNGYVQRHNHGPLPSYPCPRHRIHTYGVLEGDTLRAYLSLYRVGELALVSMILGHGAHLDNGIMYLMFQYALADQIDHGGVWFYNRFDSGTDGLRFFKDRLGFRCVDVEWSLA